MMSFLLKIVTYNCKKKNKKKTEEGFANASGSDVFVLINDPHSNRTPTTAYTISQSFSVRLRMCHPITVDSAQLFSMISFTGTFSSNCSNHVHFLYSSIIVADCIVLTQSSLLKHIFNSAS